MPSVDEILAAIDTGLQTAGDFAYGDDWPDTCWRCNEISDTDLCGPCRAELVDEKQPASDFAAVLIHLDLEAFAAVLDRILTRFRALPPAVQRQILETTNASEGAPTSCSTSP